MNFGPTAPTPRDLATSDPAPLVPTDTTAAPVTAREIAEFLRHLTDLRTSGREGDPHARAEFLARKSELFTRLAANPSTAGPAPAPGRGTP
ncbi:MAG: hypothetical protein H0T54_05855 [Geodermatophilaceae bacterium]|nr:hypothetical protein [Geodermatophilaceae bacterium]